MEIERDPKYYVEPRINPETKEIVWVLLPNPNRTTKDRMPIVESIDGEELERRRHD